MALSPTEFEETKVTSRSFNNESEGRKVTAVGFEGNPTEHQRAMPVRSKSGIGCDRYTRVRTCLLFIIDYNNA